MRIDTLSRTGLIAAVAFACGGAALFACSTNAQECRLGADCASGQCSADGLCVVTNDAGGSSGNGASSGGSSGAASSSGAGTSSSSSSSSSGSHSSTSSSGSSGSGCVPNQDGSITKDEVPAGAGLVANFRFANDATVDLVGVMENGTRKWDLTGPYDGDTDVNVTTKAVASSWYASDFPTGQYAALLGQPRQVQLPLACGGSTITAPATYGILRVDDSSLSLLGFVDATDTQPSSSTATLIVYDKPVTTLKYPLTVGATWETAGAYGSGSLAGSAIPLYGKFKDTYSSKVTDSGALVTPYAIFPVMKIVTTFTRVTEAPGYNYCLESTSKTVAFVTECGGTIAKISSADGETSDDFTAAAQLQRLAPVAVP